MWSIDVSDLPESSLLLRFHEEAAYTDCYVTKVDRIITLGEYIEAFYTTRLFKIERLILKWVASKPSTDHEVGLLADNHLNTFSAWNVEARETDQILLADYLGRTKSWLMLKPAHSPAPTTCLYFGSVVVPTRDKATGLLSMGKAFRAMLPFHKVYSQALLAAAKAQLNQ